jgi:hypothetical protein
MRRAIRIVYESHIESDYYRADWLWHEVAARLLREGGLNFSQI